MTNTPLLPITFPGFAGTPGYLSPEVLRKDPYGKPVDMWACGKWHLNPATSAAHKVYLTHAMLRFLFSCRVSFWENWTIVAWSTSMNMFLSSRCDFIYPSGGLSTLLGWGPAPPLPANQSWGLWCKRTIYICIYNIQYIYNRAANVGIPLCVMIIDAEKSSR